MTTVDQKVARQEGITKARLAANASRGPEEQFATDAEYVSFVCESVGLDELPESALDSYVAQYTDKSVDQMQTALDASLAAREEPETPPTPAPLPKDSLDAAKVAALRGVEDRFAAKCVNKGPSAVCDTPFGVVQCDLQSRANITGAVVMALISAQARQPFSVEWTMADNTSSPLDGQKMIGLGVAVGKYVTLAHGVGQALKVRVRAANSEAEVNAVDLDEGWPIHA